MWSVWNRRVISTYCRDTGDLLFRNRIEENDLVYQGLSSDFEIYLPIYYSEIERNVERSEKYFG